MGWVTGPCPYTFMWQAMTGWMTAECGISNRYVVAEALWVASTKTWPTHRGPLLPSGLAGLGWGQIVWVLITEGLWLVLSPAVYAVPVCHLMIAWPPPLRVYRPPVEPPACPLLVSCCPQSKGRSLVKHYTLPGEQSHKSVSLKISIFWPSSALSFD